MSLFETFDPISGEITSAAATVCPIADFPETVIITFEDDTFRALESLCQTKVTTVQKGRGAPVWLFRWRDRAIAASQTMIGGAVTAGLLEELLALGAKKVLLYGACGVLDSALTAGHLIIPTAAYRDEGASYHYMPVSDYVDIPTAGRLGEIFDELDLPYVKGRVWTTDGLYRETRNNMEQRRAEGCIAVDMECASVMAVARFRGVEVYQFFYAEDSLDGAVWDLRTLGQVPVSDYEKYLRIALETASRL